jgi:hypothetical protein
MRSKGKAPENGEPTIGFSFTTMLQHTADFGIKDFLTKNSETTLEHPAYSPDLGPADLHVPSTEISIERTALFYATDIIENAMEELKRFPQNGFHEFFQHLYSC